MGTLGEILTSKQEQDLFLKILSQTKIDKTISSQAKQIKEIVPIEKWLENEYYVGPDGARLYPYWKECMKKIFEEGSVINEVIVQGGIGTGKSTFSLFCMVRKLYELSCYENVLGLFDLMSTSSLVFIYFSLSKSQAELTGYGQFRSLVDSIPYFRKEFCRNLDINSILDFPEKIMFIHGSDNAHAIGMNMIGSILDEANFFQGESSQPNKAVVQSYSKIASLYSSIINRGKSRFMGKGKDSSLSILVSSSTHLSSFTEKRIQASLNNPSTMVICTRLWDVKPKGTYSDKVFFVFIGSDSLDPYIMDTVEDFNQYRESLNLEPSLCLTVEEAYEELTASQKLLITKIPIDFRKTFEVDIMSSLQDIAGVSVAPLGKLFSSRPLYYKTIDDSLEHPFTKESICLATRTSNRLDQYLKRTFRFKNLHIPRYIHIDQSTTTDSTGIAMCHVSKVIVDELGIRKPEITIDFQLRIPAPKAPQKISISKVRDFVFYLRDVMGVHIDLVTYDQFASAESRQVLDEGGFNEKHQSVDRTDEAYLNFCTLIYEGRLRQYLYQPAQDEFFDLIHSRERHKVDHPIDGSKDVMDAVVGCINSALEAELPTDMDSMINHISDYNGSDEEELFSYSDILDDILDDVVDYSRYY